MSKKKILSIALIVIMIAILSFSSLAWFTDNDSVKNEFMIATSDDPTDPDDIFSVDVWENTPDGPKDQDGHEYEDILPGDLLEKDVHVENTGAYDQYIRVTVTISDAEAWIAALGTNADPTEIFIGFDQTKWTHIWNNLHGATQIPENIVYVMYYKDALAPTADITVFTDIQIPTSLTQQQAAAFDGGFTVDIKADAVQTENVGAEAVAAEDKAWTAFQTVENPTNP